MKHLEHTLEAYVYSHCNMRNISIYFYNIDINHLPHTYETCETLETYACNMRFQRNVTLLLGRMEALRCRAQRLRGGPLRRMELAAARSSLV
jgi:hypothetical protein